MELNMDKDRLLEVIQKIKESHLSRTNFPKLMVGTGLSVNYKIAGMSALNEELNRFFSCMRNNDPNREKWESIKDNVSTNGLENGLQDVDFNRDVDFIECITKCTANLLLDDLSSNINDIMNKDTGFKKLLNYLLNTCSANHNVLDIMTPNYDLIIELICDSMGIQVIDGFLGNIYYKFDQYLLKQPNKKYILNSHYKYARLFKPHGSINWISGDNGLVKINDFRSLKHNIDKISIIAPGGDKYRQGMTVDEYRIMREEFNNVLSRSSLCPILIFGYGFNDDHFNCTIFENLNRPLLVISRSIKGEILEKLNKNNNAVAFYSKNGSSYLLFRGTSYIINEKLWDINIFANNFFA